MRLREVLTMDPDLVMTGTTLSVAILLSQTIRFAHIGDSRIYRLHNGELSQITSDDVVRRNGTVVADSLLSTEPGGPAPHFGRFSRSVGDRLLLCTWGLSSVVPDTTLAYVLNRYPDPREATDRLIELALGEGAPENVTVVIGDVVAG
jgi:protein phosphatase